MPSTGAAGDRVNIVLVNPNTSTAVTADMVAVARDELTRLNFAGEVHGLTSPRGVSLIDNPESLAVASEAVAEMVDDVRSLDADAVVLSAFGDPGLRALRDALNVPVAALAESALEEASQRGAFAIVTSTPALQAHLEALVAAAGREDRYRGIIYTDGDVAMLLRDPAVLTAALQRACTDALARWHVASLIIGGGPLARAAGGVRLPVGVALVDPVRAAVRRVVARPGVAT